MSWSCLVQPTSLESRGVPRCAFAISVSGIASASNTVRGLVNLPSFGSLTQHHETHLHSTLIRSFGARREYYEVSAKHMQGGSASIVHSQSVVSRVNLIEASEAGA
jgi:hypothetical protein